MSPQAAWTEPQAIFLNGFGFSRRRVVAGKISRIQPAIFETLAGTLFQIYLDASYTKKPR